MIEQKESAMQIMRVQVMEKEAALRMWGRSVVQHSLRSASMISDGKSKTISEIHKLNPYSGIPYKNTSV